MTQTITVEATSKAGTTRKVLAAVKDGRVVGSFQRLELFGEQRVSPSLPIRGDLVTLSSFASRQPGLFAMWVDAKFGVK